MRTALHDAAPRLTAACRPRFCDGVAAPPSARLPRLTAAMASRLSGALRLAGLDDYIAPSQVGRGGGGEGREEVGERWSPPAAVRGRGVQGGEAPMGASRPHGCWALAGLGPPGLGPEVLSGAPRHPKGSLSRPKGSPKCPRGHRATPKVTKPPPKCYQTTPTGSPSYPKGHPATPKVTKPPQKGGL